MQTVVEQLVSTEPDDVKLRIFEKSFELFLRYGFAKTRMEEIARTLRISRKTLYKYFANKHDLLMELMTHRHLRIHGKIEKIQSDPGKSIKEKIQSMHECISGEIPQGMNEFLRDIRDQAPDLWKLFSEQKERNINRTMRTMIETGIKNGDIRPDVNPDIVLLIHAASTEAMFDPAFLAQTPYTIRDLVKELDNIIFYGIVKRSD
ncbi:transcriptional regulator, TetR family [Leptospira inadai serovar Lyme str. 10]|uniref:Transcriptional regulator, TetR family n=2 Tax=Leptospira inadai serovar Lyme TaxID=293084 RepID=V6HB14_9LEPT|nr:TetR/AcrR family transcriptional regulator [Leptospira inadai]EQA36502.1 transcriptional regulator, TetR family [Leptospira inadai serovar Lyme str. 10]PNV74540.1 TetR family transcriptional regulator [Leptospira inadai serovar Lyme]